MRNDIPESIVESSYELSPDALVTMFHLVLTDNTQFHLSPNIEATWQGDLYEAIPCHMTEVSKDTDGRKSRPKFSIANPMGIFSPYVYEGLVDNAMLTRIRILKMDLDQDNDFAIRESWRVSRVMNLSKDLVSVELRDVLDGHNFILPARAYYPPEFPHVSL